MLRTQTTKQFEKDFKRMIKRGKDMEKIKTVMRRLANEEILDTRHRDHKLTGDFEGFRECHIEPDWLLVYRINKRDNSIIFLRTGSHADIFE